MCKPHDYSYIYKYFYLYEVGLLAEGAKLTLTPVVFASRSSNGECSQVNIFWTCMSTKAKNYSALYFENGVTINDIPPPHTLIVSTYLSGSVKISTTGTGGPATGFGGG